MQSALAAQNAFEALFLPRHHFLTAALADEFQIMNILLYGAGLNAILAINALRAVDFHGVLEFINFAPAFAVAEAG
jgi:hypothetical protein